MAKSNGKLKFLWIPIIGITITILAILVPYLYGAGKAQATLVAVDTALKAADTEIVKDLKELEEEGCKPAVKSKFDVAINKKDITTIQESMKEFRTEQKKGFEQILSRLREK